jgi:hypothetical protein
MGFGSELQRISRVHGSLLMPGDVEQVKQKFGFDPGRQRCQQSSFLIELIDS